MEKSKIDSFEMAFDLWITSISKKNVAAIGGNKPDRILALNSKD